MTERSDVVKKNEPKLMGAAEAAEALGVRQQNLRTLVGLPDAYDKVRATTLWRADEVLAFAQERNARLTMTKTEETDDVQEKAVA